MKRLLLMHHVFGGLVGRQVALLREVGAAIGKEARSFGTTECWSPIMGLAREPRWVRHPERKLKFPA